MKNNKGIASIVIILVVVGVLAAGGYYYWSKNTQKQVACTEEAKICPDGSSVGRVSPDCEFAECPEVKNDETANWKTHSDTVYGYEIKYPSGWVYSDRTPTDCSLDHPCISSVSIHSTIATAWVGIDVVNNNNEISIDQLKAQKLQDIKIYPEGRVEDIKIGNIRAIRVEYLPSKSGAVNWQRSIYMVNNNLIYIIRIPGVDNSPDIQKIIDQIPSTFNFIEKSGSQTTNWKTYTNSTYGYQISYPKDIYTTENLANPDESIDPNNVRLVNIKQAQESIKCECGEPEAIVISAYANPQKLSAEEYLKQNFQRWLGTPSSYSKFYINEQTTFNGISARKFGTERDQYFIFTKGSNVFTITIGDQNILNTFKFTGTLTNEATGLKVISPNGGEQWQLGKTYTIKWKPSGTTKVNIIIIDYRAAENCMLNNRNSVSAVSGEYTFKLESCVAHNMGADQTVMITPGNQYKVRVEDADHPDTTFDWSDNYFSIVGAN